MNKSVIKFSSIWEFSWDFLLLISNLIFFYYKRISLVWSEFLKFYWDSFYSPKYGLFSKWIFFFKEPKWVCILLLLDEVFCNIHQDKLFYSVIHVSYILVHYLFISPLSYSEKDNNISDFIGRFVCSPCHSMRFCFVYFKALLFGT